MPRRNTFPAWSLCAGPGAGPNGKNLAYSPKLPGLGDVDWGRFLSVLGDTGYDGPVCIEVEDRAYEGTLSSRKTALIQSGRFLRQYMT